jgi:hypothetical protein
MLPFGELDNVIDPDPKKILPVFVKTEHLKIEKLVILLI